MRAIFVVGNSGSGKTTLCNDLVLHFQNTLKRPTSLFNLDPGVHSTPATFSITDHTNTNSVMEEHELGPNGGLIRCIHDSLGDILEEVTQVSSDWCFIDVPGQIELFTNYDYMNRIAEQFEKCGATVAFIFVIAAANVTGNIVPHLITSLATKAKMQYPFFNYISQSTFKEENFLEEFEFDSDCPFEKKIIQFIQDSDMDFCTGPAEKLQLLLEGI